MKKNTLRLTVIALVAAVCAPLFLSSCSKDVNTRSATFTITNDMWEQRDDLNFYCDFAWSALDNDALSVGTINAYYLLPSGGTEYQQPLPYTYYAGLEYYDSAFFDANNNGTIRHDTIIAGNDTIILHDTNTVINGMWVPQSVNIRYDVSPGRITFMFSDLGHFTTNRNDLPTMRFRAVVTYPVEY